MEKPKILIIDNLMSYFSFDEEEVYKRVHKAWQYVKQCEVVRRGGIIHLYKVCIFPALITCNFLHSPSSYISRLRTVLLSRQKMLSLQISIGLRNCLYTDVFGRENLWTIAVPAVLFLSVFYLKPNNICKLYLQQYYSNATKFYILSGNFTFIQTDINENCRRICP